MADKSKISDQEREKREKLKELIDYLFENEDTAIEDSIAPIIADYLNDGFLFRCCKCEEIKTPYDEDYETDEGTICLSCSEAIRIAESDEQSYREAKGIR